MSTKKPVCIIFFLLGTFLLPLTFSHTVYSQEEISRGDVVSGTVPPNSHRIYYLSETLQKGSTFTISAKIQKGLYGMLYLQRGPERLFSWMVSKDAEFVVPFGMSHIIGVTSDEYLLNLTSSYGESLSYSFFYDFSQELQSNNSKSIPLQEGVACYHVDLSIEDKVSLALTSPSGSDFDIYVYFGPRTYLFFLPPVAYTVSPTSPETLNFIAEHEGRYFIDVTSSVGTGSFNLTSSITSLAPTYEELQERYDALSNELVNTRSLMFLFIVTTIIFAVTTAYLAIRKPKVKPELKTT